MAVAPVEVVEAGLAALGRTKTGETAEAGEVGGTV
jgi:hypothetical protein